MHILLVRFSSMGDVVLQTATVNWLRSLYGAKLRLSFVTSQEFVSLIDSHPGINHVIGLDRRKGEKWKELIRKIDELDENHPIDLILDLHATLRSFRLKLSYWTTPALTVDKRRWERFLLTKLKGVWIKRLISEKVFGLGPQVVRIIKDIGSIFGDSNGTWRTQEERRGPHREMTSLAALPQVLLPSPYIVLAPSASFIYKRWQVERFVELAKRLLDLTSYHVVVLAGPEDKFCSIFDSLDADRVHNLQGKTSLNGSMSVISKAALCIGNDSGMNHISEAYGVPCVTIFGPTDPKFGFAPHGEASSFLSKELWCKPCSTTGKKACYRERHFCMEMISVDEVLDLSLKALR
jgi:ADP-heptose:LPS heptosyltransferase